MGSRQEKGSRLKRSIGGRERDHPVSAFSRQMVQPVGPVGTDVEVL